MPRGIQRVEPSTLNTVSMDSIKLPTSGFYGAWRREAKLYSILLIQMLARPTKLQETSGTNRLNPGALTYFSWLYRLFHFPLMLCPFQGPFIRIDCPGGKAQRRKRKEKKKKTAYVAYGM